VAGLGSLPESVEQVSCDADDTLLDPPVSAKFNGEEAFLSLLCRAGRLSAEQRGPLLHARVWRNLPVGVKARSCAASLSGIRQAEFRHRADVPREGDLER
jgi:hypothetical protein